MAGLKSILKCYGCKEDFRREELISYCSPNSKTSHNYCPKCYEEKISRENFSQTVCKIFGLKSPGPRIWKERQRIKETYGYTDETISDCLKYIYEIKGMKKLSESLYLVNPINVDQMMKLKRNQEIRKNLFDNAAQQNYNIKYINVRENKLKENITLDNLNDLLYQD